MDHFWMRVTAAGTSQRLLQQHLVPELIRRKIEELLGGVCFVEWEASSIVSKPRAYAEDVISYLQVSKANWVPTMLCLHLMMLKWPL
jgi:hypothetical protein